MGRALGIDYGLKRIGLALSDPFGTMALPFTQLEAKKRPEATILALQEQLSDYEIDFVVIGLPHKMSGKEGTLSPKVREFAQLLEEKTGWKVHLFDERLTSAQAERALKEVGISRKRRTQKVDMIAATYILQAFLDSQPSQ